MKTSWLPDLSKDRDLAKTVGGQEMDMAGDFLKAVLKEKESGAHLAPNCWKTYSMSPMPFLTPIVKLMSSRSSLQAKRLQAVTTLY